MTTPPITTTAAAERFSAALDALLQSGLTEDQKEHALTMLQAYHLLHSTHTQLVAELHRIRAGLTQATL